MRGYVGHGSVVSAWRLIVPYVPFLVHRRAGTRRAMRELATIGNLGARAGGEAVSDTEVSAAARQEAQVRAMRANLNLGGALAKGQ